MGTIVDAPDEDPPYWLDPLQTIVDVHWEITEDPGEGSPIFARTGATIYCNQGFGTNSGVIYPTGQWDINLFFPPLVFVGTFRGEASGASGTTNPTIVTDPAKIPYTLEVSGGLNGTFEVIGSDLSVIQNGSYSLSGLVVAGDTVSYGNATLVGITVDGLSATIAVELTRL